MDTHGIFLLFFLGISLKDVFTFSLRPVSWSLANTDGSMYKSVKSNASNVMFITDQYFETSIKGGERERRASTGQIQITASRCDQPAPKQFKNYLAVGANKTELLEFLVKDWTHPRHSKSREGYGGPSSFKEGHLVVQKKHTLRKIRWCKGIR